MSECKRVQSLPCRLFCRPSVTWLRAVLTCRASVLILLVIIIYRIYNYITLPPQLMFPYGIITILTRCAYEKIRESWK